MLEARPNLTQIGATRLLASIDHDAKVAGLEGVEKIAPFGLPWVYRSHAPPIARPRRTERDPTDDQPAQNSEDAMAEALHERLHSGAFLFSASAPRWAETF